jgi:hypothetical protein
MDMDDSHREHLTAQEAREILRSAREGIERQDDRIRDLRTDPAFLRLSGSSDRLSGTTRRRWDTADERLARAESALRKWGFAVDNVARLLERSAAAPAGGRRDWEEALEQLLRGRAVLLSIDEMLREDRPTPGSPQRDAAFSTAYVDSLVRTYLNEMQRLVNEVADVWGTCLGRLGKLAAGLTTLQTARSDGQDTSALAEFGDRLSATRAAVESDPLGSRAGGDIDRLEEELEALRTSPFRARLDLLRSQLRMYRQIADRARPGSRPGLHSLHEEARRRIHEATGIKDLDAVTQAVHAYSTEVRRWERGETE